VHSNVDIAGHPLHASHALGKPRISCERERRELTHERIGMCVRQHTEVCGHHGRLAPVRWQLA
jgi:hypothetical protein